MTLFRLISPSQTCTARRSASIRRTTARCASLHCNTAPCSSPTSVATSPSLYITSDLLFLDSQVLFDALELSTLCDAELVVSALCMFQIIKCNRDAQQVYIGPEPNPHLKPVDMSRPHSLYVDAQLGKDHHDGSLKHPLRTIAAAVEAARASGLVCFTRWKHSCL